jgi:hypothetical protein
MVCPKSGNMVKILVIIFMCLLIYDGVHFINSGSKSSFSNIPGNSTVGTDTKPKTFLIHVDYITVDLGNAVINVTITNNTDKSIYINPYDFTLAQKTDGPDMAIDNTTLDEVTLKPGHNISGELEFTGFTNENATLAYIDREYAQQMKVIIP